MVDRGEVAKAHGQLARFNRHRVCRNVALGNDHRLVQAPFLFWQQGDKRVFQRRSARCGAQLCSRAGYQDTTVIQGNELVEPLGLFHVGRGNQDRHAGAFLTNASDKLPELAARERVDTRRGLVQD